MELNKLTLPDFTALFTVIWLDHVESMRRDAFNSGIWKFMSIPENTGESRRMTEIDLEQYASRKGEGDQASRARVQQGYTKDLLSYRVAKDIGISYEERTQNKYQSVIERLTMLSKLPINSIELDLSMRVANAENTSYTDKDGILIDTTGGDSLAWASTAHTLKASTTTYRNILANNPVPSRGAFEAMERMNQENSYNQFGEALPSMPWDILWTTDDPQDCNLVSEYLESSGAPDFTNSGVKNVYQYKYKHVTLPRAMFTAAGGRDTTKRHRWGMASSEGTTAYIGMWEEPHTLPFEMTTDRTDNYVTGVRAGYGICHVTGRGFSISYGDGTP